MLLTGIFVKSSVQLMVTLVYGYIFLKHSNIVQGLIQENNLGVELTWEGALSSGVLGGRAPYGNFFCHSETARMA